MNGRMIEWREKREVRREENWEESMRGKENISYVIDVTYL